jgi:hypothetical protein
LKSRILEIQNSWNPEFLKSRILEIQNLLNSWRGQFPSFGHLCSRKHFHWQNIFSNSLPRLGSSVCLSHFISSDGSFGIVGFAFRWLFRTFRPEHSQAFWSFELYLAVSFKFQLLLDWGTYFPPGCGTLQWALNFNFCSIEELICMILSSSASWHTSNLSHFISSDGSFELHFIRSF